MHGRTSILVLHAELITTFAVCPLPFVRPCDNLPPEGTCAADSAAGKHSGHIEELQIPGQRCPVRGNAA